MASGCSAPPGTKKGVSSMPENTKMPNRPIIAPAMEYSRYLMPAATASLLRLCTTSAMERRVISSKKRYMVTSVALRQMALMAAMESR